MLETLSFRHKQNQCEKITDELYIIYMISQLGCYIHTFEFRYIVTV